MKKPEATSRKLPDLLNQGRHQLRMGNRAWQYGKVKPSERLASFSLHFNAPFSQRDSRLDRVSTIAAVASSGYLKADPVCSNPSSGSFMAPDMMHGNPHSAGRKYCGVAIHALPARKIEGIVRFSPESVPGRRDISPYITRRSTGDMMVDAAKFQSQWDGWYQVGKVQDIDSQERGKNPGCNRHHPAAPLAEFRSQPK